MRAVCNGTYIALNCTICVPRTAYRVPPTSNSARSARGPSLLERHDFAAVAGTEAVVELKIDRLGNGSNGSVRYSVIAPAGMAAPRGIDAPCLQKR